MHGSVTSSSSVRAWPGSAIILARDRMSKMGHAARKAQETTMPETHQPAREDNVKAIVDYFESGAKSECTAIGIELEHTLVHANGDPVAYVDEHGQHEFLELLSPAYPERMTNQDGELIGLLRPGSSVTLEPGSQMELSAGPYEDLDEAMKDFLSFERELADIVSPYDIDVLAIGYHPTRKAADLKLLPKLRYEFMNRYLGGISKFGVCMMRGSASAQVSIDYSSVDDCLRKFRIANACVPLFSLICDNTPIFEAEPRPHFLMRTEVWEKCDPERCMLVPGSMDDGFSLRDYAEYILDTPAIVAIADGAEEYSTRTFGELHADVPMTERDVEHAISMFFTDVRLKRYIEIRPADAMPVEYTIAYAAMVKGLFYDERSLDELEGLFSGVTADDVSEAKAALMAKGYGAKVYGAEARSLAAELMRIARAGLTEDERPLTDPLARLIGEGVTLADLASA